MRKAERSCVSHVTAHLGVCKFYLTQIKNMRKAEHSCVSHVSLPETCKFCLNQIILTADGNHRNLLRSPFNDFYLTQIKII